MPLLTQTAQVTEQEEAFLETSSAASDKDKHKTAEHKRTATLMTDSSDNLVDSNGSRDPAWGHETDSSLPSDTSSLLPQSDAGVSDQCTACGLFNWTVCLKPFFACPSIVAGVEKPVKDLIWVVEALNHRLYKTFGLPATVLELLVPILGISQDLSSHAAGPCTSSNCLN